MFHMLDRAMTATGSRILRLFKRDQISGIKELFGDRQTEHRELYQASYPLSDSYKNEISTPALFNAGNLEAEIAALVKEAVDSLRGSPTGYNWDPEEVTQLPTELSEIPEGSSSTPNNFDLLVNGGLPDRHTWDPNINISNAERISPPDAKASSRALLPSLILGILGIGGILFGSVGYFLGRAVSTPVANKVESFAQPIEPKNGVPTASAEVGGQVTADVSKIDEIATLAARVSAERPESARRDQQNRTTKSSPGVQQNVGSTRTSVDQRPNPSSRPMPFPETKPTTIEGWMVYDVVGGTAVLQGPKGVWRVTRGDSLPELGKVESIVRWGNRWIVATSKGLITSP